MHPKKIQFNVFVFNSQICRKMGIIEVDYFGLQFTGTKGEILWMNLRNRISQQVDCLSPCRLRLRVKFFVEPHLILQEQTRWNSTKVNISCNIFILLLIVCAYLCTKHSFSIIATKKNRICLLLQSLRFHIFAQLGELEAHGWEFCFFLVVFLISANRKQLLKVTVYFKMPYASAVLLFCALNFDHISMHLFIWCLSLTSVAGSYLCTCLLLKLALFQLGSASCRPAEVNNIPLEAFKGHLCVHAQIFTNVPWSSIKLGLSVLWDAPEYNDSTVCSQLESGAVRSRLMRAVGGGGEVSVCLILSWNAL